MRRRDAKQGPSGEPRDRPGTPSAADLPSDDALLDLIGKDPQSGMAGVLDKHGAALLGRLHRYAEAYGDHVRAEMKNTLYEVVESLLDPDARTACRARGGQILPWLSRYAKWRVADVARGWEGRQALESLSPETPAPTHREPPAPSRLVQGLYQVFPQLSQRDQLVLRLQMESRSMKEIGAELNIGEGAAKKAVSDARRRLRRRMEAAGFKPEHSEE